MNRLALSTAILSAVLVTAPAAPAASHRPDVERASYVDRFEDAFILDLCGIQTWTTLTERWSLKTFPDGSQILHIVRTFVPDHPGIPVEKGAGTSFIAPDGSKTAVGKPIHLFARDGGTTLIDAGRALFDADGNLTSVNGPHPSLDADLTGLYCPR